MGNVVPNHKEQGKLSSGLHLRVCVCVCVHVQGAEDSFDLLFPNDKGQVICLGTHNRIAAYPEIEHLFWFNCVVFL